MKSDIKFIDLDKIIKENNPKIYRLMPRFFINRLKKIVYESEINKIINLYQDKDGQAFVKELLDYWGVNIKYCGLENIPPDKRYVIASNHPLGGLDGIAILNLVYAFMGDTKAIVNDLLLNIKNLRPVFTGVNVFGKFKKSQIIAVDELYESENQIVVFPAGMVSRKIKKEIKDLEWKKSFLTKAIKYNRDIIPVYADAYNSKYFYNFAKFRKNIGLKVNLELMYLPREMFKFDGKEIIFKFGEPIPISSFTKDKSLNYWVDYIRAKSEELKTKKFDKIHDFSPTAIQLGVGF